MFGARRKKKPATNSGELLVTHSSPVYPARTETVDIRLTLDKSAAEIYADDVAVLLGWSPQLASDDTVQVTYQFQARYLGETAAKLESVGRILDDPAVIAGASVSELEHGRSIVMDVAGKLGGIITRLEAKKQPGAL